MFKEKSMKTFKKFCRETISNGFYHINRLFPKKGVPVLLYHMISETVKEDKLGLCVSLADFENQMAYLYNNSYKVISLESLVRCIKNGEEFFPKAVVLTFDDGYRDNYINAYPVLKYGSIPMNWRCSRS